MTDAPPKPKTDATQNYMWALCGATIQAQMASGHEMSADAFFANVLANVENLLSKAYFGTKDGYSFTSDSNEFGGHSFEWYIQEMQDGAGAKGKSAWDHGKDDNEQPQMLQLLQQEYSIQNTMMQEQVNVVNGAQQGASNQSQSDNSNLQSLATLASSGNTSASYLANLEQQTM